MKEREKWKRAKEEEIMKNMSNKEKEEYKRYAGRLTGELICDCDRLVRSDGGRAATIRAEQGSCHVRRHHGRGWRRVCRYNQV